MYVTTTTYRKLETLDREISGDMFENITEICKESNLDILYLKVDKADRIGKV